MSDLSFNTRVAGSATGGSASPTINLTPFCESIGNGFVTVAECACKVVTSPCRFFMAVFCR